MAEERLHIKLPPPIREVYLYIANLMLPFYLRPLELVHWDKDYLGFYLDADNGIVIGIKRDDLSEGVYAWEETDPECIAWEYEEDFEAAYSEHDEETQKELSRKYQEYWEKLNANPEHSPLQIVRWENEPRYNHTIDGYSLFLVIHALCEVEEMERNSTPNEPTIYFSEFFSGHTSEYFQAMDRRVRADFVPLSDHPELLAQDMPMQMAYVHKNPDALLIQRDDWPHCELQLGFPWPFDQPQDAPPLKPVQPLLREILEQNLPPIFKEENPENHILLQKLPTALSVKYVQKLLKENGVRDFEFVDKTPEAVIETVRLHRQTVNRPECNRLCQRLAVLAAFCAYWLRGDIAWGFLHYATYEPLYGNYEKPIDIYVLRARAALTDFTKRHRAVKDLQRLIELDPANRSLYQAEMKRWGAQEKVWERQAEPRHQEFVRQFEEQTRQEAAKDARRLELILEKRRKKRK